MASEVDVMLGMDGVARELASCARGWEPDARLVGNVRAADIAIVADAYPALLARLREAERERDQAREREAYALAAIERNDEVHAEAIRAVRQRAERAEQTRDAHAEALAQAAREAGDAQDRVAALVVERDEARAALIRSQEDHRAAVEALETYEERIGDIADHVLGLVPPDVPSIVKLDAIERRCGEERVAARQAERERDEARAEFLACAEAIGICYQPDTGPSAPGPVSAVVEAIREAERFAGERFDQQARAESAEARVAELEAERDQAREAGRRVGREDVAKYANAIGRIEGLFGLMGPVSMRETVATVERELSRLRAIADAAAALLKGQNDWHIEDCHAYGVPDEECVNEPGPDPHCDCGAKAQRDDLRAAFAARGKETP